MNYTTSEENYLKAIFHLESAEGKVTTTAVADQLQTKPASVTDMMKKLNAKKLLHYKPYHGFSLSAEGRRAALLVVRRHRLWEYFLSEKLKFGWSEVHSMAEDLEHVTNPELTDRLDAYLGFPRFDPHGDPIPDSKGRIKAAAGISLLHLPLNQTAAVCRVANQTGDLLELLQHKQIGIGTRVEVKRHFDFDHSLEVRVRQQTLNISEQLARNIFVK